MNIKNNIVALLSAFVLVGLAAQTPQNAQFPPIDEIPIEPGHPIPGPVLPIIEPVLPIIEPVLLPVPDGQLAVDTMKTNQIIYSGTATYSSDPVLMTVKSIDNTFMVKSGLSAILYGRDASTSMDIYKSESGDFLSRKYGVRKKVNGNTSYILYGHDKDGHDKSSLEADNMFFAQRYTTVWFNKVFFGGEVSVKYIQDSINPTVDCTPVGGTEQETLELQIRASDATSGLYKVSVYINQVLEHELNDPNQWGLKNWEQIITLLPNNIYEIEIRVVDCVGNHYEHVLRLANNGPNVDFNLTENEFDHEIPLHELSIADAGMGIRSVDAYQDGVRLDSASALFVEPEEDFNPVISLVEGRHELEVVALDWLGNRTSKTYSYCVDLLAPELFLESATVTDEDNNLFLKVTGSCADNGNGTGVKTVTAVSKNQYGSETPLVVEYDNISGGFNFDAYPAMRNDPSVIVEIRARDNVDNETIVERLLYISKDMVSPEIRVIGPRFIGISEAGGYSARLTVQVENYINVNFFEEECKILQEHEGVSETSYCPLIKTERPDIYYVDYELKHSSASLSEGAYSLAVYVQSLSQRAQAVYPLQDPDKATVIVSVDMTAPEITMKPSFLYEAEEDITEETTSLAFDVAFQDELAGMKGIQWHLYTGNVSGGWNEASNGLSQGENATINLNGLGLFKVVLDASDQVGNVVTKVYYGRQDANTRGVLIDSTGNEVVVRKDEPTEVRVRGMGLIEGEIIKVWVESAGGDRFDLTATNSDIPGVWSFTCTVPVEITGIIKAQVFDTQNIAIPGLVSEKIFRVNRAPSNLQIISSGVRLGEGLQARVVFDDEDDSGHGIKWFLVGVSESGEESLRQLGEGGPELSILVDETLEDPDKLLSERKLVLECSVTDVWGDVETGRIEVQVLPTTEGYLLANEIWSVDTTITGVVFVPSGIKLAIGSSLAGQPVNIRVAGPARDGSFGSSYKARIIVLPGGTLTINNATLGNAEEYTGFWGGILAYGGLKIVNSRIEDALQAVALTGGESPDPLERRSVAGTVFTGNYIGCHLLAGSHPVIENSAFNSSLWYGVKEEPGEQGIPSADADISNCNFNNNAADYYDAEARVLSSDELDAIQGN